jgi:hypothetical protein
MSREEQIRLGDMAAHLLDDEIAQEVFRRMAEQYASAWAATRPEEAEKREQIYYQAQALNDFQQHLKIVADTGKFERAQIDRAKSQRKSE